MAGNIALAWTLTLPAAAIVGAAAYGACSIFGKSALGPALVALCAIGLVLALFRRRPTPDSGRVPKTTARRPRRSRRLDA